MKSKQAGYYSKVRGKQNPLSEKDSISNELTESKMRIFANHLIDRVLEIVLNNNKENSILIMEHNNFSV